MTSTHAGKGWPLAGSLFAAGLVAASLATPAPPAETAPVKPVRPSALAGSWYPAETALVRVEVYRMLRAAAAAPALKAKPLALVTPHAGWRFSGAAAATAFHLLHPGDFRRVVVVAPSHQGAFDGFSLDDASAYETPLGNVPLCSDASSLLLDGPLVRNVEHVSDGEHAIEIELPFLQSSLGRFCLVPILAGRTSPQSERDLASRLAKLDDGDTLFVFSSDFTHYGPRYGYVPFGPSATAARQRIRELDRRAIDRLTSVDAAGFRAYLDETRNTICGRSGLGVLLELLPRIANDAKATILDYYASADIPGFQDDSSVSYVALAFARKESSAAKALAAPPAYATVAVDAPPLAAEAGRKLVRLARATLRTQLAGAADLGEALAALPATPQMERLQGVFVTLNRTDPSEIQTQGRLRGCIGQVFPVYPLFQAVVEAAVAAAIHDTRFPPVTAAELGRIEVEVTVLSPPKPIGSWQEIELGTDGIVLEKDGRKALFLPQVPGEQGWSLEQTLTALSRKAGLPPDAWREGAHISVFNGQVFKE
jgi:AmmeMemoRadiSam system protein B/AmmeMemoRadiSam system protein A